MGAKVKFSVSIKELSFSFEGDPDTGRHIQQGIENTIGSLVNSQSRALGIEHRGEDDVIDVVATEVRSGPKRRKRASKEQGANGAKAGRKSRTDSCGGLTTNLIAGNFFSAARSVADVQKELTKKGHNFKSNVISMALLKHTKAGALSRDHDDRGAFVYKVAKK